ncbi:uncharacterized protein APUU_10313A [Aspergillus puulaauensis]|uniref:AA1-like domain-containing protein n=1 Tax=Aspergillus puulaauensis TaxID=1220207 RepID=A0A7R8AHD9_9EURO|nr:uncharacterized protein APUU_10313A [Aspergillus puulaauensis]BCS17485.1 hypothetical protein APUU_10313A [Aspergillus puulaauensis]
MKISLASASILLTALTPAVLGQDNNDPADALLYLWNTRGAAFKAVASTECKTDLDPDYYSLTQIKIGGKKGQPPPDIQCDFYTTQECDGEPFTAVAGVTYEFDDDDPFVVGSYKCEPVE